MQIDRDRQIIRALMDETHRYDRIYRAEIRRALRRIRQKEAS